MKKLLTLLTALTIVSASLFTTTVLAEFDSAKAELQGLFKLYEDFDYTEENWSLLQKAYNSGLAAIDSAEDEASAYSALNTAAESMISVEHKGGMVTACVSIEKLTVNKGFVVAPDFVRVRKYDSAAQAISTYLNDLYNGVTRNPFSSSGSIEHGFELTGVYEPYIDTGDEEYDEIDVPDYLTPHVGKTLPQRSNKGYISKGDYTDESCFILSVNNKFPNVSPSAIPVLDEDILRWQFSIYGNGADIGAEKYNSEPSISKFPDKGELLWETADLTEKNDLSVLLSNADNLKKYNDVLRVLQMVNVSQTAVDRALDKLEAIVPITAEAPTDTEQPDETTDGDTDDSEETADSDKSDGADDTDADISQPTLSFSDLSEEYFAYDSIAYLFKLNIVSGVTESEFCPESNVTRAEFVTMLKRAAGAAVPNADKVFDDVPKASWYADSVFFAHTAGITNGTSESTFSPEQNITREDIAVMLSRYAKYCEIALDSDASRSVFDDEAKISDYAVSSVATLHTAGIINGRGNNCFEPKAFVTRAETAILLAHLLQMK